MTNRDTVLQTRGLTKDFAHRAVLRHIDLDVSSGEIVGLMGANGAGKTTLLGCLASIVRPTAGQVLWFGSPAGADPVQRRRIGMVAHESRLYPHLSLKENLVFAARMYRVDRPTERAVRGLADVGLAAHADRFPPQISRGMCQRAAVARSLIHEPQILLLDEPFTGLDADGVEWLMQALPRLRGAGRTICFTTHDAAKAAGLADRIWTLHIGRLSESSAVDEAAATSQDDWRRAA